MKIFCVILIVMLAGCVQNLAMRSSKLNNIQLEMTEQQVIQVMGKPEKVAAMKGVKILTYQLFTNNSTAESIIMGNAIPENFYVLLVDSKVVIYGGDKEVSSFISEK